MHWYFDVLKKYAVFKGRARRKEYWFFALFGFIIAFGLGVVDGIFGVFDFKTGLGLMTGLYYLAVLIPSIALSVRRLHDTNKSGWWMFIGLVPFVGFIGLLIFALQDGQVGVNRFGPDPKTAAVSFSAEGTVTASTHNGDQARLTFCITCGTKFPEVAAYCPKCGARRTAYSAAS